jgi:tetratricopeptide (TPR) repeat protein
MELDDAIYNRIKELSELGDAAVDAGDYAEAITNYEAALAILPKPITEWDAATWLLTALGEAYFFAEDHQNAYNALSQAMHCPGAIGNPFVHLRLGQVQFELGNDIIAADELTRAYMGGGVEIFKREDSKYLEFVKSRLDKPPKGW